MAFFDSFTDTLKQKWLQFFTANRDWITLHMTVESVYTPDGGKRPSSYLILGVVNALEPKLAQLMFPFAKLNPDADTLIEVLDLNFDPDIVLGNRVSPLVEPETFSNQPTLILEEKNVVEEKEESFTSVEVNSFQEEEITVNADEPEATWEESASFTGDDGFGTEDDGFGEMSLSDGTEEIAAEDDAFANVSFEEADEDMNFGDISATEVGAFGEISGLEETGFGEVGTDQETTFGEFGALNDDLWSDDTSETNELEELPSDFNESEMDRLFPNN